MAGRRCAEDTILTDDQFLDTICSADLSNFLNHFRVEIPSITANDEEGAFGTLWDREEDGGDEGFGVVRLLEDGGPLPKTRSVNVVSTYDCNRFVGRQESEKLKNITPTFRVSGR